VFQLRALQTWIPRRLVLALLLQWSEWCVCMLLAKKETLKMPVNPDRCYPFVMIFDFASRKQQSASLHFHLLEFASKSERMIIMKLHSDNAQLLDTPFEKMRLEDISLLPKTSEAGVFDKCNTFVIGVHILFILTCSAK